MTTVDEIKKAIANLPDEELHLLRAWYEQFDAAQWDAQIEADVATDRLDDLAEAALRALRDGEATIWSPYNSNDASAVLLEVLAIDKASKTQSGIEHLPKVK